MQITKLVTNDYWSFCFCVTYIVSGQGPKSWNFVHCCKHNLRRTLKTLICSSIFISKRLQMELSLHYTFLHCSLWPCTAAKNTHCLRHNFPSACTSVACINMAPTGQISVKFFIGSVMNTCRGHPNFGYIWTKISVNLCKYLNIFHRFLRHKTPTKAFLTTLCSATMHSWQHYVALQCIPDNTM
jgi:hypothetical protein